MVKSNDHLNGNGFDGAELSEQDRRKIRHFMHEYGEAYPIVRDVVSILENYRMKLKIIGWALIFGASVALYVNGSILESSIKAIGG